MTGRGVLSRDGVDRSPSDATAWRRVNLDVLTLSVQRLRLLLHRRILWLRQQWQEDPLTEYRGLVVSDERADTLLSPHADDEAAFYASDPEVTEIDQRIRDVEAGLADLRSQSADRPAALDELAELFGLSEFAVNTVLLGVGPEVDPELEPLYAYAQDDATRRHATPNLALALFCPDREDRLRALDALTPDAPLTWKTARQATPSEVGPWWCLSGCRRFSGAVGASRRRWRGCSSRFPPLPSRPSRKHWSPV